MNRFSSITPAERLLALACAALAWLIWLCPAWQQPEDYHQFADQRAWGAVPHAMDVLSNLPFAAFGLFGLLALTRWKMRSELLRETTGPRAPRLAHQALTDERAAVHMLVLFFVGLCVTAAASGYYHWRPDNQGLSVDRLGMVLPFAGLLGLGAVTSVGARAGRWLALAVLLCGPLMVLGWLRTGNALPWVALQLVGMLGMVVLACTAARSQGSPISVNWWAVVAWYVLAKLFEVGDQAVFAATDQWVSGHTLKHLAAACAALPIVFALTRAACQPKQRSEAPSPFGLDTQSVLGKPGEPAL